MIERTELTSVDELASEVQAAVSAIEALTAALGDVKAWSGTLPDRLAGAAWSTDGLDAAIQGVSDAAAVLQTPEAVLEQLRAITAEITKARAIGEAAAEARARGDLNAFNADATPLAPITGEESVAPVTENGWGSDPNSRVHFHDDGPFGRAIRTMGPHARMDVDGEPLADVLGVLATEVVRGQRTAQEALDAVEKLRDRIPDGTVARLALDRLVADESAPQTLVPPVPPGTPAYLAQLVADLHAVPMVRSDPSKELEPLLAMVNDVTAGRAVEGRRFLRDLESLTDKRHESLGDVGKFEIDRAIAAASQALRDQLAAPRPAAGDQR
jgi:hypothetical protein